MKKTTKMFVMAALLMAGSQIHAQEEHQYVDLGLPSGTLWATCNVGANSPEEAGDYFAWGETTPKEKYYWTTYKYSYNGAESAFTKYCTDGRYGDGRHGYNGFYDNLIVLQAGDDAATVTWGNEWCTPTKEQWDELKSNTTSSRTTQNGISGRLYTSKKNGSSIFLPLAGYRWDRWENKLEGVGYNAQYWSSTLNDKDSSMAWAYIITSAEWKVKSINRSSGVSVRPVRSAK